MNDYIADANTIEESQRLRLQEGIFMQATGGLLAERPDFEGINDILDIACGPGGWLLEIARKYPQKKVTGVDIGRPMIKYANAEAYNEKLKNAAFQVVDATQYPLPFPSASFDLVNGSLISSFLSRDLWPQLIAECHRLLRPGGFLRIIQEDALSATNSHAISKYNRLYSLAMYKAGKAFEPDTLSITPRLRPWFASTGFTNITQKHHIHDLSFGEPAHQATFEDLLMILKPLNQFLLKHGVIENLEEGERMYEEFVSEIDSVMEDGIKQPLNCYMWLSSVFGQK